MNLPFGGINISAGATTQALSSAAAQMTTWNATTGFNLPGTGATDGDPSVKADKANNRVTVNSPGRYKVTLMLSGITDGTQDIIAQIRKNSVVQPTLICKQSWTVSVKNSMMLVGLLEVFRTDNPGNIATMPAASTTGYSGASGAPQSEVAIDVVLASVTGTPTLTIENANLIVERM